MPEGKSGKGADDIVPDIDLWEDVARAVKPLGRTPRSHRRKSAPSSPAKAASSSRRDATTPVAPPRPRPAPSPFTGLDRRTQQRLTRGQLAYDARIDLHGMTIAEAHERFREFLSRSGREGHGLVLVITGKGASPFAGPMLHGKSGYHVPERTGRLRRLFSEWIEEPGIRELVNGYQPAHPRHGGGGAFYVKLKRRRAGP
jgi:DNA-nicking Smr family endonuclease